MSEAKKWLKLGREFLDLVEEIYGEDRTIPIKPAPEPEPCKHEPLRFKGEMVFETGVFPALDSREGDFIQEICRCGAKIKATGWIEV